jgi:hypothetical protein
VDFYDFTDVEVIFGRGKSGMGDEGEANIIESMIAKNVKGRSLPSTPRW